MALFRKARPQDPLIVSITGVRIGHRIVGVVGSDPRLFLDDGGEGRHHGWRLRAGDDRRGRLACRRRRVEHGVLVDAGLIALPLPLPDGVLRPRPRRRP